MQPGFYTLLMIVCAGVSLFLAEAQAKNKSSRIVKKAAVAKKTVAVKKPAAPRSRVATAVPSPKAKIATRSPASSKEMMSDGAQSEKVLKVNGQTRNLSMMLTIKGEKDKIKFGEIRDNYKNEVKKTNY